MVDEKRETVTITKQFCESLTNDKHISLRFYHTLNPEIPEEDQCEIDAVTREDAYVRPRLEKRNFIVNQSELSDLTINLEWNDGKGNLQGIYSNDEKAPHINETYYQVKEDSIVISKEYLKQLEKGEYEYTVEFGDAGAKIQIQII